MSFAFDEISEKLAAEAIARYPAGKQASAVMPLLDIAQRQMTRLEGVTWLPVPAMDMVAERLGMAPVRVYEIATFYTMYSVKPVGKFHLQVCTTTPCWLRGSDAVVEACKKIAGVAGFEETSADKLFTLSEVECLGACVNAPMLQVNDDYYEDLDGPRTERLLQDLKSGNAPPPGSTTGRHASEPEGGRTVLLNQTNGAG